ncbi:MAG: hypothetical protein HRT36_08010 [Alphaproteobacteria bacterium]|nr:hypothetical protein [Alphaproteobacteria bacterium]
MRLTLGHGLSLGILLLGLSCIAALFAAAEDGIAYFASPEILHVARFTMTQAVLSAGISVCGALIFSLSVCRLAHWRGFTHQVLPLLLHGSSLMIVLPTTVAAHGVLIVWGRGGILTPLREAFDIPMFGLSGILLGHVFLNLPLCFRIIIPGLLNLPDGLRRQALLLNFSPWQWWRILAYPAIKPMLLGAFSLVFLLCFTSFALVLMLGGGPAATTFEVAIYEAVRFELDFARAGVLSLLQLLLCGVFLLFVHQSVSWIGSSAIPRQFTHPARPMITALALGVFILILLLLLPPIGAILWQGLSPAFLDWLRQGIFYQSLGYSLGLAACSALGNIALTLTLITALQHNSRATLLISMTGNLFLFIPTIVFGTGIFLLIRHLDYSDFTAPMIVLLANILFTLPFSLRLLAPPLLQHARQYRRHYPSLGLFGLKRLWWGDWRAHRKEIRFAASLSAAFSLGDFGVIALFHHENFTTLPWLLYSVQGRYQADHAAALAVWLLLLVLGIFVFGTKTVYTPQQGR